MSIASKGATALVASVAGLGAAAGANAAANAAESDTASPFQVLGASLGIPIVGVGSLLAVPGASRGGPLPAALLGAIGIGTVVGGIVSAFD